jgi:hypothetical protein
MLNLRFSRSGPALAGVISTLLVLICVQSSSGAECTGTTYNSTAFEQQTTQFSPYEKIYLIVSCTGLASGTHTMHANWMHSKRGLVRSDQHIFDAENGAKRGIYFWFKLSKKGPLASMFSNQDFHEDYFGEWSVETYLDDELVVTRFFMILDGVQ